MLCHQETDLTKIVEVALWNTKSQHEAYYGANFYLDRDMDKIRGLFSDPGIQIAYRNKVHTEPIKTLLTEQEQYLGEFIILSDTIWIEKEVSVIQVKGQS